MSTSDMSDMSDVSDMFHVRPAMSPWVFRSACCFLATLFVGGFVSNVAILLLYSVYSMVRSPFNLLLVNLIVAELCITCWGLPVDFTASSHLGWDMGRPLCILTGFNLTTFGTVSIVNLAVLSVHRYLHLSRPRGYPIENYRQSISLIAFTWIYALGISVPPLFGWGQYVPETSGMTCAPDWESFDHLSYNYWFLIVGFLLPLFVILASSFKAVQHLKESVAEIALAAVRRRSEKRERRLSLLVLLMNVAFVFCWMPYGIVAIIYILCGENSVAPVYVVLPLMCAKTSVLWNPFLYVLLNFQFRNVLKSLLHKWRCSRILRLWRSKNSENRQISSNGEAVRTQKTNLTRFKQVEDNAIDAVHYEGSKNSRLQPRSACRHGDSSSINNHILVEADVHNEQEMESLFDELSNDFLDQDISDDLWINSLDDDSNATTSSLDKALSSDNLNIAVQNDARNFSKLFYKISTSMPELCNRPLRSFSKPSGNYLTEVTEAAISALPKCRRSSSLSI